MRNISFSGPEGATTAAAAAATSQRSKDTHTMTKGKEMMKLGSWRELKGEGWVGFVWVLRVAAFNIGNRTENGAYSVLAVFGQAKETTTLPRDLWPGVGWGKTGWLLVLLLLFSGGTAVATFYCFCCIAKRINCCWWWWFRGWLLCLKNLWLSEMYLYAKREEESRVHSKISTFLLNTIELPSHCRNSVLVLFKCNLPQAASSQRQSVDCHHRDISIIPPFLTFLLILFFIFWQQKQCPNENYVCMSSAWHNKQLTNNNDTRTTCSNNS